MNALVPLVVAGPLLAAAGTALMGGRPGARRAVGLAVSGAVLLGAVLLVVATRDGDVLVAQVAGWPAGIAIPFAADLLSALMITVTALLTTTCLAFAAAAGDDRDRWFVPLALVLSGGVYGAFVTADLFNLFVLIEVALIPSYVLLTRSGGRDALTAGRVYVTVSLLASTVFLAGVALVYGVAGTVNLGELAGAAQESPAVALAAGAVLVSLGVKAALVPAHGWLPRSYPYASPAVTALFSGLLTKVGVYAFFRVYAVVFDGDPSLSTLLLVIMLATMVVGVLGALGQNTMRSILVFHMISQVGYIMLGLAFFGPLGMAAAIFYLLHHTVVKASLFLSTGAIEVAHGTGRLSRLGGELRRHPVLGLAFLVGALSLAGIPPFSGFFAKFILVSAAISEQAYLAAALAVVVSLFTLLSMMKIWNAVFWGRAPGEAAPTPPPAAPSATASPVGPDGRKEASTALVEHAPVEDSDTARRRTPIELSRIPLRLVLPGLFLALVSVAVGLGAEGLLSLAQTAAEGLVDPAAYVQAVLG
ncbi:monovalent cation/H+ antiporter subunit D family protein [Trujillonella humicola]|uniref:monovalent cation/H+ antiporter subunit D family protein n=1 Tax=Trujillonella humicola TaxID=3383699 RepID=UPI0039060447